VSHAIHPDMPDFIEQVGPKIELIIVDFFLPMYFALSGINTNIGSLNTGELWGDCIAIILIASGAKFLPAMLTTKFLAPSDPDTGKRPTWKFAVTMGFIMNTRGLVELIALNIGHSSGILSDRLFTMLVLMAIITTVITTPAMHYLYLKDHPQEPRVPRTLMIMKPTIGNAMFGPSLMLSNKEKMPSAANTPRYAPFNDEHITSASSLPPLSLDDQSQPQPLSESRSESSQPLPLQPSHPTQSDIHTQICHSRLLSDKP
jgi:hypothetical protein